MIWKRCRIIRSWRIFSTLKTASLYIALRHSSTTQLLSIRSSEHEVHFHTSETSSLKDTPSYSPTHIMQRRIILLLWSDSPTMGVSDYPGTLRFSYFWFSDLDLICSLILSTSKCFSDFHSLSWADLEQVCINSKANSWNGQATNFWTPLYSTVTN